MTKTGVSSSISARTDANRSHHSRMVANAATLSTWVCCARGGRLKSSAGTKLDVDLTLLVLSDDDRCGFLGECFEG